MRPATCPLARTSRCGSCDAGCGPFRVERDDLPQENHGGLITWKYPPAYYLIATPAYLLPFLHTDTERLYAVRSVSAILGAITVWLVLAAAARGRSGAR